MPLNRQSQKKELSLKVTYIQHSGFAVEYQDFVFIFDYYKGELPVFDGQKRIYVFASHAHHDHYQKQIFEWSARYPDITYILSDDIRADVTKERIRYIGPNENTVLDGMEIQTLRSTDEGVAFFVSADGMTVYHAGDLNWWHWEEEGAVYNRFMKERYQREIAKIEGKKIDAAFVPLDPRLGKQYYWGMDWFMKHTDTAVVFPMHMWDGYEIYDRLMEEVNASEYKEKVVHISRPSQVFECDKESWKQI